MFRNPDVVTLVKQGGQRVEGIKADVQPPTIFIDDGSVPIEEGDRLLRTLPNRLVESYLVEDRGYWSADGSFPAHYQVKVRKESAPPRQAQSVVYNLHGPNSRVNIQSIDISSNLVEITETNLFTRLRETVGQIADEQKRSDLLRRVDELEEARGTATYTARYRDFIASAADHLTVLQPFIPALAQLLGG